jgi:hypothetical protein
MKALPKLSSLNITAPTCVRCLRHFSRRRSTSFEAHLVFEVDAMSAIQIFLKR